mmetsp:Transcript_98009/g.169814  ORF Transcript_98009/g.169814 Transcript_98009/m.169814 type:complete len:143 (-) Transcript_98009:111-539(-)
MGQSYGCDTTRGSPAEPIFIGDCYPKMDPDHPMGPKACQHPSGCLSISMEYHREQRTGKMMIATLSEMGEQTRIDGWTKDVFAAPPLASCGQCEKDVADKIVHSDVHRRISSRAIMIPKGQERSFIKESPPTEDRCPPAEDR